MKHCLLRILVFAIAFSKSIFGIVILIVRAKGAIVISQCVSKILMLNFLILCWLKVTWVGSLFRYMISHPKRVPGRSSYTGGCSVHNQRIERLWGDALYGWTSYFYKLFSYIQIREYLDVQNTIHLWSLQYVFQQGIDELLHRLGAEWTAHLISTWANKTSEQLWILGMIVNRQEEICLGRVSNTELCLIISSWLDLSTDI